MAYKVMCISVIICMSLFTTGNGKTHYIRSQLTNNSVTVAVNETFSVANVIEKLNTLSDESHFSLFFNFTLFPPGVSCNKCKY